MEKNFWLERWERSEIGFHEGVANAWLQQYWPEMSAPEGAGVFVPLCGKSVDMQWLRLRHHRVLGVELSRLAVEAFFREQSLAFQHGMHGRFEQFDADGIRLLCGDFFDLTREDLGGISCVYDRASMVALPPEMRARYAAHLMQILPAGARILLITFDYPQVQMPGPPFALGRAEIEHLYGGVADIRMLADMDVLPQNPRFASRGISSLRERIFILQKK